jgi:hypothetical protein
LWAAKSASAAHCFALVVKSNTGNDLHFATFSNDNDIGSSVSSSQIQIINFLNGEDMTYKFLNFSEKRKIIFQFGRRLI